MRSIQSSPKTPKMNKTVLVCQDLESSEGCSTINKSICTTPISIKLKNVEINSPKSLKVKKSLPIINRNLDHNCIKSLSVSLEPIEKIQELQTKKRTPKRKILRDISTTPCSIRLEVLKGPHVNKRDIEVNSSEKTSVIETPKRINNLKGLESTPQVQFSEELKIVLHERNVLTAKTRKHVFDALDDLKMKGREESRKYKREKALLEIINTEIKYVHQLEILINFFLKPTQEKKLLRDEDFQVVFGNITSIYNINKELLDKFEENPNNVAKAIWRIAPFFKVYSVYAYEFKNILNILQNARALNPQFAKFLENQESRPEVQSKLSALLITPIQRVPRYKLLLTQLLELTNPSNEEHLNLKESLEKIEEAADHINKILEDQENMQRLLELQRIFKSGEPNIVKPGRKLIKEGILNKIGTKNEPREKLYVVLMNDILLFGKMKKELKVNSMKCMSIFPLGKSKVFEILDKGCMRITCQQEELTLYNEQLTKTKSWIEAIRESIERYISDRKTLRKDSSSRRPVKRKDLHEYHEVGISPGMPLKKRKLESQNLGIINKRKISGRKPIKRTPWNIEESHKESRASCESESSCQTSSTNATEKQTDDEILPEVSKEVYVFGKPHPNDSGFRFGRFLGGVGSSIKKLFSFKN